MTITTRADFVRALTLEAHRGDVRLIHSATEGGILCRRHLAGLFRRGDRITLGLSAHGGITVHRDGGISFVGIPRRGGTSILWGAARERVRTLGRKHRAREVGPVGIYIGEDF